MACWLLLCTTTAPSEPYTPKGTECILKWFHWQEDHGIMRIFPFRTLQPFESRSRLLCAVNRVAETLSMTPASQPIENKSNKSTNCIGCSSEGPVGDDGLCWKRRLRTWNVIRSGALSLYISLSLSSTSACTQNDSLLRFHMAWRFVLCPGISSRFSFLLTRILCCGNMPLVLCRLQAAHDCGAWQRQGSHCKTHTHTFFLSSCLSVSLWYI